MYIVKRDVHTEASPHSILPTTTASPVMPLQEEDSPQQPTVPRKTQLPALLGMEDDESGQESAVTGVPHRMSHIRLGPQTPCT